MSQTLIENHRGWGDRVGTLTEGMRDSKWSLCEHVLFMFRRVLLIILVVFGGDIGWLQLLIFIVITAVFITFKVKFRPYKCKTQTFQDIFTELIVLTVSLIFFAFLFEETELVSEGYGQIIGYS